jgi:hypothetical protein
MLGVAGHPVWPRGGSANPRPAVWGWPNHPQTACLGVGPNGVAGHLLWGGSTTTAYFFFFSFFFFSGFFFGGGGGGGGEGLNKICEGHFGKQKKGSKWSNCNNLKVWEG